MDLGPKNMSSGWLRSSRRGDGCGAAGDGTGHPVHAVRSGRVAGGTASWYAVSAADRVIDPAPQRFMANRAGWTTVQFDDASHAGGFTHYAARFTKLIEVAVEAAS
jgi:hypothetical protein